MGRDTLKSLVGQLLIVLFASLCVQAQGQPQKTAAPPEPDVVSESRFAPVEIDGKELFPVGGVSAMPAQDRAAAIAKRIKAIAADRSIWPTSVYSSEVEYGTAIFAGQQRLMIVFDGDAQAESIPRKALADLFVSKIQNAIVEYRAARTRQALLRSSGRGLAATAILLVTVVLIVWLLRRFYNLLERTYRERIRALGIQSFKVVRAEQIWNALQRIIKLSRVVAILAACFIYLQYVLVLFPWTRGTGLRLRGYLLNPLETLVFGAIGHIPNIIFLIILYFIAKYVIQIIHKFFDALKTGDVKLQGFDAEWADSTYKLIRLGIVVLVLVVAYPYIPGGNSDAFKGITIFIGILVSLGSSSAIANLIAGYTMTYRRAFRVGDRIKIGDIMGDVTEMRLQVTHLKTFKNEEVTIPNSTILNNEVINYSSLARTNGLILYSRVNIGYEVPWRQVEALLLLAADRTPEIMREPKPFILQKALDNFAVTYEINVYCDNPLAMGRIYTGLHRNILDLFNEYGVQIMTPAYENDPKAPKLVKKENWFSAPAVVSSNGPNSVEASLHEQTGDMVVQELRKE
jgi:small-conductance mechanosensitive channel